MQWKCLPVPRTSDGKSGIHYTTIYKAFAKWSDDGSLEQACVASVRHLAAHDHLDLSVLHGDGTNTVAKKGGDGIGYSGHKQQKGEKSSRSSTTTDSCWCLFLSHQSTKQIRCSCQRG